MRAIADRAWTPRRIPALLASLLVFVGLYAACGVRYYNEGFLTPTVFINLLSDNAMLGVVAIGMTFVILSGGIDLSVGAVLGFASVLIGVLIMERGWRAEVAIGATLALGALFGALQGAIIHYSRIPAFIVTLAGMFLARGVGFLLRLDSISISDRGHENLAAFAITLTGEWRLPITALTLLASVIIATYALAFTGFGRAVYAIGGDEEAARLMGVAMARTRVSVYAISGFFAALGGVVLTLYTSSGSHVEGVGLELDAIAAVVVGGTLLRGGVGSAAGTLIGVLIIGLISAITTYEGVLSSGMTRVTIGMALLAFVLLQKFISR